MRKSMILTTAVAAGLAGLLAGAAFGETRGPQRFSGDGLIIDDYLGRIAIEIVRGGEISVTLEGDAEDLTLVEIAMDGSALRIDGEALQDKYDDRWWRRRNWGRDDLWDEFPLLTVRLPRGAALEFIDSRGEAAVRGDLDGPLRYDSHGLDLEIGNVSTADIAVSGSGDVVLGDVAEELYVRVAGSGDVQTGRARSAEVSVAGSGDVEIGDIAAGLEAAVAGSGDIEAGDVSGPVEARISGSGGIRLRDGRAEGLTVRISGSGGFAFDGVAVDPDIRVSGSGDVRLGGYEGNLQMRGDGDIRIDGRRSN